MVTALRLPLLAVALALPLLAQTPKGEETTGAEQRGVDVLLSDDGRPLKPAEDGGAHPVKNAAPPIRTARGQCRFDVSVRPARLLPGQTGTLVLTMILESDAVMEAPASLTLEEPPQHAHLSVGPMTIQPPEPGGLAAAYAGRPVYDNWAMATMPIRVAENAPLGSTQQIGLNARFALHQGATGTPLGEFGQRLQVNCEIGVAHEPQVAFAAAGDEVQRPAAAEAPPPAPEGPAAAAAPAGGAKPRAPVAEPAEQPPQPVPAAAARSPEGGEADLPPSAGTDLVSLWPLGAGAAVLLVLVVLLARRR